MKKLVNEKRDELKQMPRDEFIDRILNYSDQNSLNRDSGNRKRDFPVGKIAEGIAADNYNMSEKQYYALVHDFAGITTPQTKVSGSMQFKDSFDLSQFVGEPASVDGAKATYDLGYVLHPEEDGRISVNLRSEDGELQQIGFAEASFLKNHPITEDVDMRGTVTDYSNGKFKNVSYSMEVDLEKIDMIGKPLEETAKETAEETMGTEQAAAPKTEAAEEAAASKTEAAEEATAAPENPLALTDADLKFADDMTAGLNMG